MKTCSILFSVLRADFLERTRRSSFLMTICLVIYLGYAVNTGQILILLDSYRGVYNSAWVGSLMAVVITFFLGLIGFFLVKNSIERDERTGVGQIIATTSLTRREYLLAKWLSNFAVLACLVGILALAAVLMQVIQREVSRIELWPLIAPLLWIALPMMALVAALAVFFETVRWLKGGFGNLVYFFLFIFLLLVGVQLEQAPWLDVIGLKLVGSSMKAAAQAAFPAYDGSLVLSMISHQPRQTFVWPGLDWTPELVLQRLSWLAVALGVVLLGVPFFDRFDPSAHSSARLKRKPAFPEDTAVPEEADRTAVEVRVTQLTPVADHHRFHFNFLRLVGLEGLLLVKGLKGYWLAGMALLWIGCLVSPTENLRQYWFMLVAIWPVLVWSRMGEREARYQTGPLVFQAPFSTGRLLACAWLAGVALTAVAASGVLLGRLIFAQPLELLPWGLAVVFIPTLALTLGTCSCSSKMFEVVYPILWYLGPLNPQNQLTVLDYLGIHPQAPVHTSPHLFAGLMVCLLLLAWLGRRRQGLI